jgi:hypothetical protein
MSGFLNMRLAANARGVLSRLDRLRPYRAVRFGLIVRLGGFAEEIEHEFAARLACLGVRGLRGFGIGGSRRHATPERRAARSAAGIRGFVFCLFYVFGHGSTIRLASGELASPSVTPGRSVTAAFRFPQRALSQSAARRWSGILAANVKSVSPSNMNHA